MNQDDHEWSDYGRNPSRPWVLEYVAVTLFLVLLMGLAVRQAKSQVSLPTYDADHGLHPVRHGQGRRPGRRLCRRQGALLRRPRLGSDDVRRQRRGYRP